MLNKVQLIGNAGNDPDVKTFQNGGKVANFRIATSETYKDKAGVKQEKTEWHSVACFDKVADIVEKYLRKGNQLYLEGKIQTRQWEDKDKVKRYTTEIVAQTIRLLGGKKNNDGTSETSAEATSASATQSSKKATPASAKATVSTPPLDVPEDDSDLPF